MGNKKNCLQFLPAINERLKIIWLVLTKKQYAVFFADERDGAKCYYQTDSENFVQAVADYAQTVAEQGEEATRD